MYDAGKLEIAFTLAMIQRAEQRCLRFGKTRYGLIGGLADCMGEEIVLQAFRGSMSQENPNHYLIWQGRHYEVRAKHQSVQYPLHQDDMMTVMMPTPEIRTIMADPNDTGYFVFVGVYGSTLGEDKTIAPDIGEYSKEQALMHVARNSNHPMIIELYEQYCGQKTEISFNNLRIGIVLAESDFLHQTQKEWWVYTKGEILGFMSKKAYFDQAWPVTPGCFGLPSQRLTKFSNLIKRS